MTFWGAKAVASIATAAPPTTTSCNVCALSYEWMDIQMVTHCCSCFIYILSFLSPPFLFFFFGRNDDLCTLWMETVRGMMQLFFSITTSFNQKAPVHRAQYPLSVPPKTPLLLLADFTHTATICHYHSIIWRGQQKSSHQRQPEIQIWAR